MAGAERGGREKRRLLSLGRFLDVGEEADDEFATLFADAVGQ